MLPYMAKMWLSQGSWYWESILDYPGKVHPKYNRCLYKRKAERDLTKDEEKVVGQQKQRAEWCALRMEGDTSQGKKGATISLKKKNRK